LEIEDASRLERPATARPQTAAGNPHDSLLGRDDLLANIDSLLRRGQSVLLFGPANVGKSALIDALAPKDAMIVDPFERVSSHLAARIRREMECGVVCLAAARSLDRAYLGSVRRFAWRFDTVRVLPLCGRWMQRLVSRECARVQLPGDVVTPRWRRSVVRLARGRPGLALGMVRAAADIRARKGRLPSPAAAYVEAAILSAGFTGRDTRGLR
jgi:hypothetical protein